jgi:hypothetical protein
MAIATVNLKFGVNIASFTAGLSKVEREMGKIGGKMQSLGKAISLGVTLPIAALGAASIKAASDAQETFSKFETVFRDIQGSAESAFKTLRSEYGLSGMAAKQMLGDTGDLLTGFGFSQQGALDLSMEVQKLAVDLASFTNYSGGAEGASKALTKALLGEREELKSLGIAIMEEDVKRQMALNSAKGMTFETERQAKAHATLQLAMQQSGNAIGDYARTSDSFANQSRLLKTRLEDISVELGMVFLPLATKLVGVVTGVVEWFTQLDSSTKRIIAVVGALVAAIGPLLFGLGFIISNIIPALKIGFLALQGVFTVMTLKILAVVAAVTGLILVGKAVYDSWDIVGAYFGQLWDKIKLTFIQGVATTLKAFNRFTSIIGLDFSDTISKMEKDAEGIQSALDAQPVITFGQVMSDIGGNIMKTFSDIKGAVMGTTDEVEKTNKELATSAALAASATGGGGIKRTKDEGISAGGNASPFDLNLKLPEQVKGVITQLQELTPAFTKVAVDLSGEFQNILQQGIATGLTTLAQGIGGVLSGVSSMGDLGRSMLGVLADMMGRLGEMAIQAGIAVAGIKVALTSLNPVIAIAAGVALVALAATIKGRMGKMSSGGGGGGPLGPASSTPARAMGGSVQMGTPYLVGERGPEMFTPSGFGGITNARQTAMGGGGMQSIHVTGTLRGSGTELKAIIDEVVRVQGRST